MDECNNSKFGNFIFDIVKDFYDNFLLSNSKIQKNEWTIISSLIMQNDKEFKLICFSNGTKSLPNLNYHNRKFQIFDCHSEILTLKCFQFFLCKCLIYNIDKENKNNLLNNDELTQFKIYDSFYNIFDISKNDRIKLKKNVYFHLYISTTPCGDCSINKNNINKRIGSKTLSECIIFYNNNEEKNKLNVNNSVNYNFRTKSIRSDFKKDYLSFSLSCTDKLMIKNILGYQGKYLNQIMEKIFINSIIISSKENENDIKQCINSINYNLRNKKYDNNIINHPKVIFISKFLEENNILNKTEKNSQPFSSFYYFPSSIQKIDPSIGLKSGSRIDSYDKIYKFRGTICKYDLCEIIFQIIIKYNINYLLERNLKKIIVKYNNIDSVDLFNFILDKSSYVNVKNNLICENIDLKEFLDIKNKILKDNFIPLS